MTRGVLVVFGKELREALRDRRSLVAALLYCVWGPAVAALVLAALARSADPDTPLVLRVDGAERAPSLVRFLQDGGAQVETGGSGAAAAVGGREPDFALVIPEEYPRQLEAARPATLWLLYDSTRTRAAAALRRLRGLLQAYARDVANARLVLRGVTPSAATPLDVQDRDLATAEARAGAALATLPIFLLLAAFVSSMNVAIDVTAGERERRTLEALLAQPVARGDLAVGKWLAASTLAVVGTAATLLVAQALLRSERIQALDLPLGFDRGDLLALLAVLLPLALLAPAAQMLMALFAHSFREAQTHLSLLLFAPMLPGFLFAFGALEAAEWMGAVPVLGHQLLVAAVLRGEPPGALMVFALGAASLLGTSAALFGLARLFGQERLLRVG